MAGAGPPEAAIGRWASPAPPVGPGGGACRAARQEARPAASGRRARAPWSPRGEPGLAGTAERVEAGSPSGAPPRSSAAFSAALEAGEGHDDARLRCLQTLPDTMREATLRSPLDAGLVYCGPIDASVCLAVEVALATPPRKAPTLLPGPPGALRLGGPLSFVQSFFSLPAAHWCACLVLRGLAGNPAGSPASSAAPAASGAATRHWRCAAQPGLLLLLHVELDEAITAYHSATWRRYALHFYIVWMSSGWIFGTWAAICPVSVSVFHIVWLHIVWPMQRCLKHDVHEGPENFTESGGAHEAPAAGGRRAGTRRPRGARGRAPAGPRAKSRHCRAAHEVPAELSADGLCQKREASSEMDSDVGTADRTESTAALDELSEREEIHHKEAQGGPPPRSRAASAGEGGLRAGLPLVWLRREPDAREAEGAFDGTPVRRTQPDAREAEGAFCGTPVGGALPPVPPPFPAFRGAAGVVVPNCVPFVFARGVLATASCLPGAAPPAAAAADPRTASAPPVPPPRGPWPQAAAAAWAACVPPPPAQPPLPLPGVPRRESALGSWPAPPAAGPGAAAPPGPLPSAGSALHALGLCKPCAFVHTKVNTGAPTRARSYSRFAPRGPRSFSPSSSSSFSPFWGAARGREVFSRFALRTSRSAKRGVGSPKLSRACPPTGGIQR
ncbi:unnamed protein product [Prorocentrum cordatum]|uniref:Glycerophosphocholine acyltransferase 1 n=1 Tax=Prorocentrum cordatum TaxID=2364126 RepID=A0ABN9SJR5_9DINO|nr:unnamed protein product [Polarella glacialis]